jgi:hypothetical protein
METGESGIKFISEHRQLPPPLNGLFGFFVGGTNRSDDLFMYIFREVSGLVPNTPYRVELSITFATNVPAGCFGIGGSPGESVYIKAGGFGSLPQTVLANNYFTTNFDHGTQAESGNDTPNIGDFTGGGGGCSGNEPGDPGIYGLKTLAHNGNAPLITTDSSGRLWLIVGSDSGFEGRTEIYYIQGFATLTPIVS